MRLPKTTRIVPALAAGFALFLPAAASAAVTIDWVSVGDVGNPADSTGYGAVGYNYKISKYEVTLGQYAEFLNAKAKTDTYGLYNTSMGTDMNIAGIRQSGVVGSYTYSVIGSSNRPVTYVSWFDAARFCNWMHNGQGTGDTESGAYALSGEMTGVNSAANSESLYRIPTEDEWYKAAYYDPTPGASGNNYWLYPTQSDSPVGNQIGGTAGANYYNGDFARDQNGLPTALTDVGAYGMYSDSYYGTFDQGGNVWEWNDAVIGSTRGLRGGSWSTGGVSLQSSLRNYFVPADENSSIGFRLATVPEPSSVLMVVLGGVASAARRRRPTL